MNYVASRHMEENGVVRAVFGNRAVVETVQQEACSGCGAAGACQAMGGSKQRTITAENQVRARVGDRVLLATPRKGVLSASFLVYMVPTAGLILGAVWGQRLGVSWGIGASAGAALVGVAALAVSGFGLRWVSKRLEGHRNLVVRVVRILNKGEVDAVEQCASGV